jgi:hypothetical protein
LALETGSWAFTLLSVETQCTLQFALANESVAQHLPLCQEAASAENLSFGRKRWKGKHLHFGKQAQ